MILVENCIPVAHHYLGEILEFAFFLLCYATERRAQILVLTANNLFQLQGYNLYRANLGDIVNIFNLCQFGWYKWINFREEISKFLFQTDVLGHCLGPTRNDENEMCRSILQMNIKVIPLH